MTAKTVLSIIIPTYNSEKTIYKTLKNVIKKTSDIKPEIIIVDDGSTDDTILEIEDNFSNFNIDVIKNSHSGVSHARNTGLNIARGKYVMFVDADDMLKSNLPQKLLALNFDLINISASIPMNRHNNVINSLNDKLGLTYAIFGFSYERYSGQEYQGGPYSKLYKRSMLIENKIYFNENISNSEDVLFNIDCIVSAKNILLYHYEFYSYFNNKFSVTHMVDKRMFNNHIQLVSLFKHRVQTAYGEKSKGLLNKIELLYLYQLIFRYFVSYKNLDEYLQYLNTCKHEGIPLTLNCWELTRPIEKLTIFLLRSVGFSATISVAKIYNYLKKLKFKNNTVI